MLMDQIKKVLKPQLQTRKAEIEPGLHHFEKEKEDRLVRYHLRIDTDGSGLLIANAAAACRLSPTGVVIAGGLLEYKTDKEILGNLSNSFTGVDQETMKKDIEKVRKVIEDMAFPGGKYPLMNLDDPDATSRGRALAAPLSAEMGIDGSGDPKGRVTKLWEVAVPQVVFIHLPGATADKLVEGVEAAEDQGLIAGIRAPASALLEDDLLERLVNVGLDHVDIYFASANSEHHDFLFGEGDHAKAIKAFQKCKELEIFVLAVIPVVEGGLVHLEETLKALPDMGVSAATLFVLAEKENADSLGGLKPGAIRQSLVTAEEIGDKLHLNLVFAPPVERDPAMSLADQVRRGPRAAGEAAIRVTPDGSVIPAHGPRKAVGNLFSDPFSKIWSHDAFKHLRESVLENESCEQCPGLSSCVSYCPADPNNWACCETMEEI